MPERFREHEGFADVVGAEAGGVGFPGCGFDLIQNRNVTIDLALLGERAVAGHIDRVLGALEAAHGADEFRRRRIDVIGEHAVPDEIAAEHDGRIVKLDRDIALGMTTARHDPDVAPAKIKRCCVGRR